MVRWRLVLAPVAFGLLLGCSGLPPSEDRGGYRIDELLPLAEGNVWDLEVLESGRPSPGTCRLRVGGRRGDNGFEIRGEGGETVLAGEIVRDGLDLEITFDGMPLTILREPVEDGGGWRFVARRPGRREVVNGRATVRYLPPSEWDFPALGPLLGSESDGALEAPAMPREAVEVRLRLQSGRRVSHEIYVFLPGIGFAEIRRSLDGKKWSRMRLVRWELVGGRKREP